MSTMVDDVDDDHDEQEKYPIMIDYSSSAGCYYIVTDSCLRFRKNSCSIPDDMFRMLTENRHQPFILTASNKDLASLSINRIQSKVHETSHNSSQSGSEKEKKGQ